MSNDLRGYTLTIYPASIDMETETCCNCGVLFAMSSDYKAHRRRKQDTFYCPNGHGQSYRGKSDAAKLKEAEARETALRDQLSAAVRDAENARVALLRDRQRFANGVCPCCNRSFENVRQHMTTQHPEYRAKLTAAPTYKCSCGRRFDSFRGLRTHQGWHRPEDWDDPKRDAYSAHLTTVTASA